MRTLYIRYHNNVIHSAELILKDPSDYYKLKYHTEILSVKYIKTNFPVQTDTMNAYCYGKYEELIISSDDYHEILVPAMKELCKLNFKTFEILHNKSLADNAQVSILIYEK